MAQFGSTEQVQHPNIFQTKSKHALCLQWAECQTHPKTLQLPMEHHNYTSTRRAVERPAVPVPIKTLVFCTTAHSAMSTGSCLITTDT